MDYLEKRDVEAIERLGKQSEFLLNTYMAELARGPTSCGMESSRNLIVLWHTFWQIYGKAVARGVASLVYANTKRHTTIYVVSSKPLVVPYLSFTMVVDGPVGSA